MEKTLTEIVREQNESIYTLAAKKFDTHYKYVWMIANGDRKCVRGKGKLIKEYLEQQIKLIKE